MRTIGTITIVVGLLLVVYTMPAVGADVPPFDLAVTVEECSVTISPSGRTAFYNDSEGRSGGPIHTPDSVTLAFPAGGWVDVELIHKPGADDGESVTKRFEIEPCLTTTTTQPETSTTSEPETTTTVFTTTTVLESTTSSSMPDTTTTSTATTTSTQSPTTTATSSTSTVPPTTPTTTIHTDTTIVESDDCSDADGQAGLCLPNTGADSAVVFAVGAGLMVLGGATVFAMRGEQT